MKTSLLSLTVIASAAMLAACGGASDGGEKAPAQAANLSLNFAANPAGEADKCNPSITYTTSKRDGEFYVQPTLKVDGSSSKTTITLNDNGDADRTATDALQSGSGFDGACNTLAVTLSKLTCMDAWGGDPIACPALTLSGTEMFSSFENVAE